MGVTKQQQKSPHNKSIYKEGRFIPATMTTYSIANMYLHCGKYAKRKL
jgi:hypothetical protein